MKVISILKKMSDLENQRWDYILKGADVDFQLFHKMETLEKKLEKYSRWYGNAFRNGLVTYDTLCDAKIIS